MNDYQSKNEMTTTTNIGSIINQWSDLVNDRHIPEYSNSLDCDPNNEISSSSSQSFSILANRRRRTNSYSSPSFSNLLGKDFVSLIGNDEEPNLTIDGYEDYIENKQFEEANATLEHLIQQAKDPKDKSKIYRLAANANKKFFFNNKACSMYEKAEESDPISTQNYIDHAKLLDEIGQIEEAERILQMGLKKTNYSEGIITKLIKQFERRQKFDSVRQTLGDIYKQVGFQKSTAPSFAEGALFESRHGNVYLAIDAFNQICQSIAPKPGYYVELAENIKRRGFKEALQIVIEGVNKFSAMPNNWCQLIQLQKSSKDVRRILDSYEKKTSMASKLEQSAAVMCASFGDIKSAREIMSYCIGSIDKDQKWKFLYNASMIELLYGDDCLPTLLLEAAAHHTPVKFDPVIVLAHAKVYEIFGKIDEASECYKILKQNYSNDWRIFLEKAMFHVRRLEYKKALKCAKEGLEMYPNTGRLWALRVQLEKPASKISVLLNAIMASPKSGEIWTEAARIVMNPLSPYFNLKMARFFLNTAYLFTPQYIDLFIEMIRLEILQNGFFANLDKIKEIFLGGDGNYGTVIFQFRKLGKEFSSEEFEAIKKGVQMDIAKNARLYQRAIARTSFVVGSIITEEKKLKRDTEYYNHNMFAFGLSSFLEAMTNQEDVETYKSVILGSSSVFM